MRWMISALLVTLSAYSCFGTTTSTANRLATADQLYDRWSDDFDYDTYQSNLQSAIALYQDVLGQLPEDDAVTRLGVLLRLSQACFELGEGYLTSSSEVEATHNLGKDYALAALRLDADFVSTERQSFRAALSSAKDVRAIFWYGNNLGRYLEFHQFTAMAGGVRDIQACFERAVELDHTYLDGAPLRSLASFHSQVPGFLGGDRDLAQKLHQQAMSVSSTLLENAVNWAEYGLGARADREARCSVLRDVVAQSEDLNLMATWPFYNERAARRARDLLAEMSCDP